MPGDVRGIQQLKSATIQEKLDALDKAGKADTIDSVRVTWPDGTTQEVALPIEVDRMLVTERAGQ